MFIVFVPSYGCLLRWILEQGNRILCFNRLLVFLALMKFLLQTACYKQFKWQRTSATIQDFKVQVRTHSKKFIWIFWYMQILVFNFLYSLIELKLLLSVLQGTDWIVESTMHIVVHQRMGVCVILCSLLLFQYRSFKIYLGDSFSMYVFLRT